MSLPPVEREEALLYDLDPEVVAAAVASCPAVAAMSGGPSGAAATYLPGRSVTGVRLDGERVEVHVTLAHLATVSECGAQIRRALLGYVVGRPVDIVVEDVVDAVTVVPPGAALRSAAAPTGMTPGGALLRPGPLTEG